ncbi:MAG: PQQ-binding-like beta-propeller repeat protein [Verrucomicrobia bacterium]|nr:PQQ-binding-like beta-propeller repeat protein [Verrucomicrobiota bacterium]
MMIVHEGIVYTQWTDGLLSAIELRTGKVLAVATNVAMATAPFVAGEFLYSYSWGRLSELRLRTLELVRTLDMPGAQYFEAIPYDSETRRFCLRRRSDTGEDTLTAFQLPEMTIAWERGLGGAATNNFGSAILPGDGSVCIQAADDTRIRLLSFNLLDGRLNWATDLGPGNYVEFYNPIYDRLRDRLYVFTMYNGVTAVRRENGEVVWHWPVPLPNHSLRSTLTHYRGVVYAAMFQHPDTGAYAALDADTGQPIWIRPGFFREDGWSPNAVAGRYLFRNTHGPATAVVVQDRHTGDLVWSEDIGGYGMCTSPVLSDGIAVFGTLPYLVAVQVGRGFPVNASWAGAGNANFYPGAVVDRESSVLDDTDEDGLPDIWEMETFGHRFVQGADDTDGDGVNDLTEYVAGTDIRDPHSVPRLALRGNGANRTAIFPMRKASGIGYTGLERRYTIETSRSLDGDWEPYAGHENVLAGDRDIVIPAPLSPGARFFRVRVWLQPIEKAVGRQ